MSPAASSRWCPTPEQLMMLEELYRTGIRTPNASQIQRITAHLSLYGKIEGKNVFYWFQNHKARDRQKLRRKIIKQLQHQHLYHPFTSPTSSSLFHPHSCAFLPHHQRTFEGAATEMVNEEWKVEIPENMQIENSMMKVYGYDWMMTMMEVGPSNSPCTSRPLETLQLFPITSTNLKEE